MQRSCCGPIFVAGAAHSDGSHVTTSANCGNNATKVSWETHTKLHALWLKGRGKQKTRREGREREKGGGWWLEGYMALGLATRRRRQSLAAAAAPWPLAAFHFPFFAIPCNVYRLWGISIIVISNISNCTSAILAWRSLAVFWLAQQRKLSWSWLLFLQRFLSP